MPSIQKLTASVVNKIAAGEVIERPGSIVKEMMENSVDAGATRIDVSIGKGGIERIRVTDNGCGIAADELTLAVSPHATSKIRSADDLFSVATLGFRGEALASIAEVSRLLLRSRTGDATSGAELEIVGGRSEPVAPCGCPVGTTVDVRNLFFNTPVRRKFLRTAQTEMSYCSEAFTRLALANPHIHFTLSHNDRPIHDLPPTDDWRERIARFFGQDLADSLIEVSSIDDPMRLAGWVADPSLTRSNNRWQYLFLNGRAIRDRSLQHALSEAYRGLVMTGRYPICFLRFEIPPDTVDVNVHPSKLEVRFQDSGRLYSQLLGTLREKFLTTDLTARLLPTGPDALSVEQDIAQATQAQSELVDWAKHEIARQKSGQESGLSTGRQIQIPASDSTEPLTLNRINVPLFKPFGGAAFQPATSGEGPHEEELTEGGSENNPPPSYRMDQPSSSALQVHNRYLITETEEGMVVIDQHALHERILYEQIREKVLRGALESQQLLVPEPVDLSSAEAAAVLEHQELLAQLGVKVEPFGGETVLVSSYPAMLANLSPAEMLRDLVDLLMAEGKTPERRDLIDELLHMISCKAAIKAGDRLTPGEVSALLEARHLVQDSHHCPHGRPTALTFTREELDRQFKRI